MGRMEWYEWTLISIVMIGGLNWGLVAFGFNLVTWLATTIGQAWIETVVYGLVGTATIVSGILIALRR